MPSIDTSQTPIQQGEDLSLLYSWLCWYSRVALGIGFLLLLIFALRGSPASLIIGTFILVVVFPGIRFGMRVAERGSVGRRVRRFPREAPDRPQSLADRGRCGTR